MFRHVSMTHVWSRLIATWGGSDTTRASTSEHV